MASLDDVNIEDLKAGYALVEDKLDDVTEEFYNELFTRYPDAKPLFIGVKINQQKTKLASSLRLVMGSLISRVRLSMLSKKWVSVIRGMEPQLIYMHRSQKL